ncbi:Hypothetical protein SMAX5B_019077, partial [Scophthalmus maximus]
AGFSKATVQIGEANLRPVRRLVALSELEPPGLADLVKAYNTMSAPMRVGAKGSSSKISRTK